MHHQSWMDDVESDRQASYGDDQRCSQGHWLKAGRSQTDGHLHDGLDGCDAGLHATPGLWYSGLSA